MHEITIQRSGSDRGASSVEYGLLIALIAGVIIATVIGLGAVVRGLYQDPCSQIADHTSSTC